MKPKKLIWQIYPASLLVVLVAVIALAWYGMTVFRTFYISEAINDLDSRANLIKSHVNHYLAESDLEGLRLFSREAGRQSSTRITIIDDMGLVLADSNEDPETMDNHRMRPEIAMAFTGQRGDSIRYSNTLREHMLYVAIPMEGGYTIDKPGLRNDNVGMVVRVSMPITSLEQTIGFLKGRVLAGCIIVVIAAALLALLISRNISRSLENMTASAEQFARGDFSKKMVPQLSATSSLEVTTLATSMDRMAEMLDDKIRTIVTHRNQLETVFSSMVEAVIAIDCDEKILSLNSAAAQLFGSNKDTAPGKLMQEVVRHSILQEQTTSVLESGESIENEITLQGESGERLLHTNIVSLTDHQGKRVGVLLVMNDLTNIRKLERIRSDFVANVSHELRTPITSIRGYVETLLDGALDSKEDSVRFLEIVLRQTERLTAIIDDLLALSRIEQESNDGKISLEEGPLCGVLDMAVQTCQVDADKQGVTVDLECPENLLVMMNDILIEQAVLNLLVNAIKYSKEGDSVLLTARALEGADRGKVSISVKDTGIGIASEHLPRLFERFYRSDKARSRSQGGTGLGLAIVKHIAQAHDGGVDVTSSPGSGQNLS